MKNLELITLKIFNTWDPVEDKNFWEAIIEIPVNYSLLTFIYIFKNLPILRMTIFLSFMREGVKETEN